MVATATKYPALTRVILSALFLLLSVNIQAATNAMLDRDKVYTGDTFVLTIQTSGQKNISPDLTPLDKDFTVLGTGKSTQVSITNGKRTDSSSWTIRLQPKRTGTITIPAIKVGSEQTRPLAITITDIPEEVSARMAQHFFIEVEADTGANQVYVQQQIPYTVRLFYDNSIIDGQLAAPLADNAVIEPLNQDRNYTINKNGKQFTVLERRYTISPEKSGELNIAPVQFRGRMLSGRASQGNRTQPHTDDLIDQMFNNSPFTNDPFFNHSPTQAVSTLSKAITIKVLPRAGTDNNWVPAEKLTLEDSWNKHLPNFKSGEPVTRIITITTQGLAASQLPELEIAAPANTRMYTEPQTQTQTDGKTLYGINKLNITYIPEVAGQLTFPEIKIDWWNTKTNQQDSTLLPARQVDVAKGAITEPAATNPTTSTVQAETAPATEPPDKTPTSLTTWLIWLLAGIISCVLLWQIFRKLIKPALLKRQERPVTINPNISFQQFRQTCEHNMATAAASTLLGHAQALWPQQPPRSLRELAGILTTGKEEVLQLDRHLYGNTDAEWNGQPLWNALKTGLQRNMVNTTRTKNQEILKPLYPS